MRYIDLSGKRFGHLLVVERISGRTSHNIKWKCQCDCGNITSVFRHSLINGKSKSCGCTHYARGNKNPNWKGCGNISLRHFHVIRKSAIERCLPFEITIDYLWSLFLSQKAKCSITGLPLTFDSKNNEYDGTASLDRIDSSKGYVVGNVHWTNKEVNMMKRHHSMDYFVEMCRKVVEYDRNKKTI